MVSVVGCDAQAAVVRLCELWWGLHLDQCELLVSNILPILLTTAMESTARVGQTLSSWFVLYWTFMEVKGNDSGVVPEGERMEEVREFK